MTHPGAAQATQPIQAALDLLHAGVAALPHICPLVSAVDNTMLRLIGELKDGSITPAQLEVGYYRDVRPLLEQVRQQYGSVWLVARTAEETGKLNERLQGGRAR